MNTDSQARKTVLLVGASRGLGYAMCQEFLKRGWNIIGTVRGAARTALHDLAQRSPERVEIATLDITISEQIAALRLRLENRKLDILFVNAGVTNNPDDTIGEVSTEEFIRVMVTNALGPMRVLEALYDVVTEEGTVGVMSSGQGSVTNNTNGMREVYRGSKAALNMFMRSFAARHSGDQRAMVLMAPGWVRTELGGPEGRLAVDESVPNVVSTLLAAQGHAGLQYLDYLGRTLPW
jgi:NAD(P)-dependent dehydrogenase (short-subunit alcohol dehydrogenase family)